MSKEKLYDFIEMKNRIGEIGATIEKQYDNYSGNFFRYFEYKGAKIMIDGSNDLCAPKFYWNRERIKLLFDEILPQIETGEEDIYINLGDGDEQFLFTWNKKGEIEWTDFLEVYHYLVKSEDSENKIKKARLKACLTQAEMSERFEIPRRTIEDWEKGKRTPPKYVQHLVIAELERIACKEGLD